MERRMVGAGLYTVELWDKVQGQWLMLEDDLWGGAWVTTDEAEALALGLEMLRVLQHHAVQVRMERGPDQVPFIKAIQRGADPDRCPVCGDEHTPHCKSRPHAIWDADQEELRRERAAILAREEVRRNYD